MVNDTRRQYMSQKVSEIINADIANRVDIIHPMRQTIQELICSALLNRIVHIHILHSKAFDQLKTCTLGIRPNPPPVFLFFADSKPVALLSRTCSLSNRNTSESLHRVGTGRYAALNAPTVCAHSPLLAPVFFQVSVTVSSLGDCAVSGCSEGGSWVAQ
jgi:hypothetical protein